MNRVVVENISHGGAGISRINGKVVFVKNGLPGEIVDIKITDKKKDYDIAEIINVIKPSRFRVEPACKYYGLCGGCDFQHIDYSYQIELKKEILGSVLKRIGKVAIENIEMKSCNRKFNYRRRMRFKCNKNNWGFFKKETNDIVHIDSCLIAHNEINDYIKNHKCSQREIVLSDDGSINSKTMILDLSEVLPGLYLTYNYGAFVQVNKQINIDIVKSIVEKVQNSGIKNVMDFFGGIGNFSLPLAVLGVNVISFDSDKRAVDSFNKNAKRLGVKNIAKSVRKNLNKPFFYDWNVASSSCVILDPPRSGAKSVVEFIKDRKPELVFYISCEPSTLARDLRILKDYYIINKVIMFDMFPQTHHFESLVELEYKNGGN